MRFRSRTSVVSSVMIALFSVSALAQTGETRQVNSAFAVFTAALDVKTAVLGQEVLLLTVADVKVDGRTVIPLNSQIVGHVTKVTTKGRDQAQAALAVVIDKAVRKDGITIPLQAIIAAVAAPRDNSLTSDPAYAMLHSNEPRMDASASSASRSGELSASSKANSTAAVAAAELKGKMDEAWQLTEDSQGAVGYDGLSVSWSLATPPPFTVFVSKKKDLKLGAGTQVLLRMVPPHLPE